MAVDLKNEYSEIKGFTVRNMQYMIQFYNEYNKELTMVKCDVPTITKSAISQLGRALPTDFRGSLPTIEEIEKELERQ